MIPLKLLVVDDDESLCGNLKSFFERRDYKVQTAFDGPSAVRTADHFHPHIMFLDIGLPSMSGMQVLEQIKEHDPRIRVIMITGQTEDELMRQARVLGADDYITKPFTLDYLSGTVLEKMHRCVLNDYRMVTIDLGIEREKFEQLFEECPDGVLLLDRQGFILQANPAAHQLLSIDTTGVSLNSNRVLEQFRLGPEPLTFAYLKQQSPHRVKTAHRTLKKNFECHLTTVTSPEGDLGGHLLFLRDLAADAADPPVSAPRSIPLKRLVELAQIRATDAMKKPAKIGWSRPAFNVNVWTEPVPMVEVFIALLSHALHTGADDIHIVVNRDQNDIALVQFADNGSGTLPEAAVWQALQQKVEAQAGRLWAKPDSRRGMIFYVSLPVAGGPK